MPIHALPSDSVRRICAGQVIVDVASAVKELIENSIDAGATSIIVHLESHGHDGITVTDNGAGIPEVDRAAMGRRYCTSKITGFSDLETVTSLGFRGEALNSLATVSQTVKITTRTAEDPVAIEYTLDGKGEIAATRVTSAGVGTTVVVTKLFHSLPVRRATMLRKKESLRPLLVQYAVAHPEIHWTLLDKERWVKPRTATLRETLGALHGRALTDQCQYLRCRAAEHSPPDATTLEDAVIELAVPADTHLGSAATKAPPLFLVNQRPVKCPKPVSQAIKAAFDKAKPNSRASFYAILVTLDPSLYDVNVEPNKSVLLSECLDALAATIANILGKLYRLQDTVPEPEPAQQRPQPSLSLSSYDSDFDGPDIPTSVPAPRRLGPPPPQPQAPPQQQARSAPATQPALVSRPAPIPRPTALVPNLTSPDASGPAVVHAAGLGSDDEDEPPPRPSLRQVPPPSPRQPRPSPRQDPPPPLSPHHRPPPPPSGTRTIVEMFSASQPARPPKRRRVESTGSDTTPTAPPHRITRQPRQVGLPVSSSQSSSAASTPRTPAAVNYTPPIQQPQRVTPDARQPTLAAFLSSRKSTGGASSTAIAGSASGIPTPPRFVCKPSDVREPALAVEMVFAPRRVQPVPQVSSARREIGRFVTPEGLPLALVLADGDVVAAERVDGGFGGKGGGPVRVPLWSLVRGQAIVSE
ncbi:hypothetical protein H9P43_003990 [Blastocladiella emersonii ATCC 22665]|nr:hypothetical protein H9P43_003990 [Blastocladiella emersonii ATCC 22665]